MRVLILGGDGMLGHQLFKHLQIHNDVRVTVRQDLKAYEDFGMFNQGNTYSSVNVLSLETLMEVLADFKPQAVVNCVGIVKQRSTAKESIPSLEINALLPHRLAVITKAIGARLVHLSTDCIFSGKKGNYSEHDQSDAEDLYGRTKYLGEVHESNCLTLRTSIIGRELSRRNSLLEWFLAQTEPVKGFRKAIFSGFTTMEMSRIIDRILLEFPHAKGVYHISSDPINKYELLLLFREKLGHDIEIIPDDTYFCDRSLNSDRFRSEFNYTPPSWPAMIEELRI